MVGVIVGAALVVLAICSVVAVVMAVVMGLPTLALIIGLISGAFFAGRAV